jgi:hypothetical protein
MATRMASRCAAARGLSTARRSSGTGRGRTSRRRTSRLATSWLAAMAMSEHTAQIQAAVPLPAAARVDCSASRLSAASGSRGTGWLRRTSRRRRCTGRRRTSWGSAGRSCAATGLAAASVGSKHPVEQVEPEALSTQAKRQHHRSKDRIPLHFKPLTFIGGTVVNCRFPTAGPPCATATSGQPRAIQIASEQPRSASRGRKTTPNPARHEAIFAGDE